METHTRKDGTFVDLKAEKVAEMYKKNKEAKLTALEAENSQTSDSASNDPQLSIEEDNKIFLLVSCFFYFFCLFFILDTLFFCFVVTI